MNVTQSKVFETLFCPILAPLVSVFVKSSNFVHIFYRVAYEIKFDMLRTRHKHAPFGDPNKMCKKNFKKYLKRLILKSTPYTSTLKKTC